MVKLSARLYEDMVARAKHFLNVSGYDVSAGRYDIALFHLEQSVQIALKAYLLKTFGDFPKVHSLKDLIDLSENNCLKKLAEDLWYIIDILEDAYIGARYLNRRYGEKEYREALRFVQEVFKCIGISIT